MNTMKFVFEVKSKLNKENVEDLRRIMCGCEVMINTALPKSRVHLTEEK